MKKLLSIALLTMSFAQPVLCMENNNNINNNNNESKKIVLSPEEQESLNDQLIEAIKKNDPNTVINQVTKLLDQGADVNLKTAKSNNELRPLHGAIINNNLALAKLLLNKNADVNAKNLYGETPLHFACGYIDNIELINLLLNNNADITAISYYGETSLSTATNNTLILTLLRFIIKPTLDWNQKKVVFIGNLKETPLDCHFATLPLEMIHNIFSFFAEKKENIAQLKKLIDLSNITTDSQEILGDILNPQSWADEKTAEKSYYKLIELIKQMDEQNKNNKETKE